MKAIFVLCVSFCTATTQSNEVCDDPVAGSSMVQQSFTELKRMDTGSEDKRTRAYTTYVARPALEYFKDWSHGSISHQLENLVNNPVELLGMTISKSSRTGDRALKLMHDHMLANCAGKADNSNLKLHDASTDDKGVHHTVFTSPDKKLQYVAFVGKYIMHADPPLCPSALMQDNGVNNSTTHEDSNGGGEVMLSLDDKKVEDCTELFHRTVTDPENCGADMDIMVKSARLQIVDGIGVEMYVKVSQGNQSKHHHIMCDFEVPSDHEDAKDADLLQLYNASGEPLEEEKLGLEATLVLDDDVDICDLSKKSGVTEEEDKALDLMEELQFGELSRFKGYEYLSEVLPRLGDDELNLVEAPEASDLRTRYPKCFPKKSVEVVRNQGQCGSCWAFAVASTIMNELCVSGMGTNALAAEEDRLEVSVAQIMACNPGKRGCNGGHAVAAHKALSNVGITRERVSPYACGGKPKSGVDKRAASCSKPPWGPKCLAGGKKEPTWNYAGATAISGEAKMKALVAQGHSLYGTFSVYPNFMTLKKEIYAKNVGKQLSGHAVVIVAYGKDDATKWWLLQNSWGSSWGDNGYGKFLRGKNLAGIEDLAYYMRSWVKGGSIPPCFDGTSSGMKQMDMKTFKPVHIGCKKATDPNGFFGNYCVDKEFGAEVKASCPVTCGACLGGMGSREDWGTGKATPEAPAPPSKIKAPVTTTWTPPQLPSGGGSDTWTPPR